MKKFLMATILGLAQLMGSTNASAQSDNAHHITMVMKQQFDRPEAPLTVAPIVVDGNVAVAGWLQGGRGGRAFLQKEKDHWTIAVCGGAGLTQAEVLQSIGISAEAATRLAEAVKLAERPLGPDKRKLFDSFEGMMKIDPADGHGNHGQHHEPQKQ